MKIYSLALIAVVILCGCESMPSGGSNQTSQKAGPTPTVARYLAWYEGDLQTDYQVNREVAASKAEALDSKQPSMEDADAFLEYVSLLDASGKHDAAGKKIPEFLVKNPDDKRGVFLLAVHFWRTGKKELTSYFFAQLEKDANFPWKSLLLNNLGMMALQDKNRLLAIDYFQKATKEAPATAAPFVNLGALYLQSRSFGPAQPLFERARELDDDFEDASVGLGVALEGQGKFDEAAKVYSEFTSSHPDAMTIVYNQSVLLGNRLGRKEEASQMMLRYIQRGGKETAKAQEIIQTWR